MRRCSLKSWGSSWCDFVISLFGFHSTDEEISKAEAREENSARVVSCRQQVKQILWLYFTGRWAAFYLFIINKHAAD